MREATLTSGGQRSSVGNVSVPENATNEVAIVVALGKQPPGKEEEQISLHHLEHYLGAFDRYLVAPEGMRLDRPGFRVKYFPTGYFGSIAAHTRMMLSPSFYEAFSNYRYILTYHLDALVFSSELLDWCALDYDFIGAPRVGPSKNRLTVVGNGGFALRKVESFLKVLRSRRFAVDPDEYWRKITEGRSAAYKLANLPRKYLKRLHAFNNIKREIRMCMQSGAHFEDIFITLYAQKYYPAFRFAPLDVALQFAFDEMPRTAFEMNGGRLPFGCHAWFKQDREFWEPHLLTDD